MPHNYNLKSMKLPKKTRTIKPLSVMEQPRYPYGLEITLNKESLQKLGEKAESYIVGKDLYIMARVKVSGVRIVDSENSNNRSVDLQITDMKFETHEDGSRKNGEKKTIRNTHKSYK